MSMVGSAGSGKSIPTAPPGGFPPFSWSMSHRSFGSVSEVSALISEVGERLPSVVGKTTWIRRQGSVVHASGESWMGCGKVGKAERMAWRDLTRETLCTRCLRDAHSLGELGKSGVILSWWGRLAEVKRRAEEESSVFQPERWIQEARSLGEALLEETRSLSKVERAEVEEFVSEAKKSTKEAKERLRGESGRRALEEEALSALGVERSEVEDTPTLLGVGEAEQGEVAALSELFSVREGLLVLPRFLAEWVLVGASARARERFTPMVSVEDARVREVAVGLWDPERGGVMASLHACVVAARRVLAESQE